MITTFPDTLGQGPQGPRGFVGGLTFQYRYQSATTPPPASGRVRLNNADPTLATHIYVHKTDRLGADLATVLAQIGPDYALKLFGDQAEIVYAVYRVQAAVDAGDYFDFTVIYSGGAGGGFEDARSVGIGVAMRGNVGGLTLEHEFDDETGAADPGAGKLRYNHATPASVTHLYISDTDRRGNDVDAILDDLETGDRIKVFHAYSDSPSFHFFRVVLVTDAGDYHDVEVAYIGGAGAIAAGDRLGLSYSKSGGAGSGLVKVLGSDLHGSDVTSTGLISGFSVTFTLAVATRVRVTLSAKSMVIPEDASPQFHYNISPTYGDQPGMAGSLSLNDADGTTVVPACVVAYHDLAAGTYTIQGKVSGTLHFGAGLVAPLHLIAESMGTI